MYSLPNRICGAVKAEVTKRTKEMRFEWYGHVMRNDGQGDEKQILKMEVQGRRKGRSKTRQNDCTVGMSL